MKRKNIIIVLLLVTAAIVCCSCNRVDNRANLKSDGEQHTWTHVGGKGDIDLWKVTIDSSEYIIADGMECVAIIKHK